jgi:hypothetical protein
MGMDAFEQLVSEILWMEGYWVRTSVKVELTKDEKRQIGRPSSPRWELDIVAYSGRENLLKIVECKSYLDSRGVALRAFDGSDDKSAERFKLFTDERLRAVVFERLAEREIPPPATSGMLQLSRSLAWCRTISVPCKVLLSDVFQISTAPRRVEALFGHALAEHA